MRKTGQAGRNPDLPVPLINANRLNQNITVGRGVIGSNLGAGHLQCNVLLYRLGLHQKDTTNMTFPTPDSFVPRKRRRGHPAKRSRIRDTRRDAVMKMIFARPGFASAIAKHLGVKHQSVSAWRRVPSTRVLELTEVLDMTPEQIRPDVFTSRRR